MYSNYRETMFAGLTCLAKGVRTFAFALSMLMCSWRWDEISICNKLVLVPRLQSMTLNLHV